MRELALCLTFGRRRAAEVIYLVIVGIVVVGLNGPQRLDKYYGEFNSVSRRNGLTKRKIVERIFELSTFDRLVTVQRRKQGEADAEEERRAQAKTAMKTLWKKVDLFLAFLLIIIASNLSKFRAVHTQESEIF